MQILHFSDNHGDLRALKADVDANGLPDVFLSTGDFFPNKWSHHPNHDIESAFQIEWFFEQGNGHKLKIIIQNRPFVSVSGNHDFIGLSKAARLLGIKSYNISTIPFELLGYKWAGFAQVPFYKGHWNGEAKEDLIAYMCEQLAENDFDILVTHTPPAKILDLTLKNEHVGSTALKNALATGLINPDYHFFGHIHEMGNTEDKIAGTTFYNGATKIRRIEI